MLTMISFRIGVGCFFQNASIMKKFKKVEKKVPWHDNAPFSICELPAFLFQSDCGAVFCCCFSTFLIIHSDFFASWLLLSTLPLSNYIAHVIKDIITYQCSGKRCVNFDIKQFKEYIDYSSPSHLILGLYSLSGRTSYHKIPWSL